MKFVRIMIRLCLYIQFYFHKLTKTGAFGSRKAEYLTGPIATNGNGLKRALIKYHVKQYHEASCSVASVVSVVNAIRDHRGEKSARPIGQPDILDTVRTGYWRERMEESGHNGRRGLPLKLLGKVVASSLEAYGIPYRSIETVQAERNSGRSEKIKEELRNRLLDFETKGDSLIIIHFNQGAYVQALHIPHISPVGGFDPETGKITILDVDPLQEKPYQISFDRFYDGIASNYNHLFRPFGYGSGGYVYIKLSTEYRKYTAKIETA